MDSPGQVNDHTDEAWLVKIKPTGEKSTDELLDAIDYEALIGSEQPPTRS